MKRSSNDDSIARYFGDAGWTEGEKTIRAPVGLLCWFCDEPIGADDSGLTSTMGLVNADEVARLPARGTSASLECHSVCTMALHRECHGRDLVGSVGHQMHVCGCYGGRFEDPPGLTKREAAAAACEVAFVLMSLSESGQHALRERWRSRIEERGRAAYERRSHEAVRMSPQKQTAIATECPACGTRVETATSFSGEYSPEPGDWSVCSVCAAVLRFDTGTDGLQLRKTTVEERVGAEAPDTLAELMQLALINGPLRFSRTRGSR